MVKERNVTFQRISKSLEIAASSLFVERAKQSWNKRTRGLNFSVFVDREQGGFDSAKEVNSYIFYGRSYLRNLKQLAEKYPGSQRQQVKIIQGKRDYQILCEERERLVNRLRKWVSFVSSKETSSFGENRKKRIIIEKFGQEFAEYLLKLNLQNRKPFVTILLADFPVTNSIWKRMQKKQKSTDLCDPLQSSILFGNNYWSQIEKELENNFVATDAFSSKSVEERKEQESYENVETGASIETRGFYDALFESMAFHPKGVVATYRLRETLECLLQPSFETPGFIYFGDSSYDWELFKDSLQSCLQQLALYTELFYRQCFLEVGMLAQDNFQKLFPFYRRSLEISACSSSESSKVAAERFAECGRRIFYLYHKQFPSYPLAFADVVVTSTFPNSMQELASLELSWNDVTTNAERYQFSVIMLECVPSSEKHIRAGFHHNLLTLLLYDYLPRTFGNIGRRVYSLSHISGFLSWLNFQYEIALGLRPQHRSVIPQDYVHLIGRVIREIQSHTNQNDDIDKQLLEQAKNAMLPLCAYYLLIVRRRDGLPVDPNCAFHITNGAEIHQLLWAADEGIKTLKEGAQIMSLYCYDLQRLSSTAYKFASTSNIPTSDGMKNLLQSIAPPTSDLWNN